VPAEPSGPVRFAGLLSAGLRFALLLAAAALVAALVGAGISQPAVVAGITESPAVVRLGIPVFRTLVDLGAATVAGLALLSRMLGFDDPARTEPVMRRARPIAVWASLVWAISAFVSIVLLAWEIGGEFPGPAQLWAYLSNIPAGKGLLLSGVCGLASWWLARLAVRHGEKVPAELRAGVALFGLLPLPLTGHASNWYWHDLAMVSMELHVVAATAWAGGLAAVIIFLAAKPALLAVALPRFSKLATWCVFIVALTGLFNGLIELALSPITTLPGNLVTTPYGVLLVGKMVCMGVIAATASVVRFGLLPRIAAGRRTAVAVWCGWELLVLAVAFGIAVALTRAPVTPF
jgi:putative copper resistance protein D